jgi:ISXO2 transposase-like protein
VEEGVRGRQTVTKAFIAVGYEKDGEGIGRIRMRRIPDATADSLQAFIEDAVTPGSLLHTDGLLSYDAWKARLPTPHHVPEGPKGVGVGTAAPGVRLFFNRSMSRAEVFGPRPLRGFL